MNDSEREQCKFKMLHCSSVEVSTARCSKHMESCIYIHSTQKLNAHCRSECSPRVSADTISLEEKKHMQVYASKRTAFKNPAKEKILVFPAAYSSSPPADPLPHRLSYIETLSSARARCAKPFCQRIFVSCWLSLRVPV